MKFTLVHPPFNPASSPLATHTPYTPKGVNTPDGAPTPERGLGATNGGRQWSALIPPHTLR